MYVHTYICIRKRVCVYYYSRKLGKCRAHTPQWAAASEVPNESDRGGRANRKTDDIETAVDSGRCFFFFRGIYQKRFGTVR